MVEMVDHFYKESAHVQRAILSRTLTLALKKDESGSFFIKMVIL